MPTRVAPHSQDTPYAVSHSPGADPRAGAAETSAEPGPAPLGQLPGQPKATPAHLPQQIGGIVSPGGRFGFLQLSPCQARKCPSTELGPAKHCQSSSDKVRERQRTLGGGFYTPSIFHIDPAPGKGLEMALAGACSWWKSRWRGAVSGLDAALLASDVCRKSQGLSFTKQAETS